MAATIVIRFCSIPAGNRSSPPGMGEVGGGTDSPMQRIQAAIPLNLRSARPETLWLRGEELVAS